MWISISRGGLRNLAYLAIDKPSSSDWNSDYRKDEVLLLMDMHRGVPSLRKIVLFECPNAELVLKQRGVELDYFLGKPWKVPSLNELERNEDCLWTLECSRRWLLLEEFEFGDDPYGTVSEDGSTVELDDEDAEMAAWVKALSLQNMRLK